MIQDILPLHMKNQYEKRLPSRQSRIVAFRDDRILIKKGEQTDYMSYQELAERCEKSGQEVPAMVYLFAVGERDYFLAELPEATAETVQGAMRDAVREACADGMVRDNCAECDLMKNEYEFVRMFEMRRKKPKEQVLIAATAWHLYCWYRDNQYCGRCTEKLMHSDKLRMLKCPCCGNQVFPKIAPAVIVGVTNGEYILMTKYANREYKRYALIAGFTEIGETAEETVCREVLEEVGLHVKNIRYYKSQPWGFDSNLLLGYFCELDDTDEICLDEEELATAEWVHYKEIPEDTEGLSLTREMMTVFRERNSGL
ncbi:MAG: NAD(+) diphosphatase [Clostridiales bacterium]|nr:NAD(+) diphosphatase [Roseburia sp.]MDD7635974.1 NAD(+) diphosphatase [Clostridiales bacterium]